LNLPGSVNLLYVDEPEEFRMHQCLTEILDHKKNEVAELKKNESIFRQRKPLSGRDFKAAISKQPGIRLIAEIKFASPSAGLIRKKADPAYIGRIYEDAGAAAISLLTDERFFQGDLEQLPRLKKAIGLPILRKDFIIDAVQVRQSYFYGADAVLLIARILSQQQLTEYIELCRELGMTPLTEVHSAEDLEKAVAGSAGVIGINNRDLDSFTVDLNTTFKLAPLIPNHCLRVSESGISSHEDVRTLKTEGIHAVLVGSALMRSRDLAQKTKEIVNAGRLRDE
jgi:indole-3-glycerol phosphate synthase